MAPSTSKFRLFDLVIWGILIGVGFGYVRDLLVENPQQNDILSPWVVDSLLAFGLLFAVWFHVRSKRSGPACAECGKRFSPHGQLANSTLCARCRADTLPRAQSRREQVIACLVLVLMLSLGMAFIALPLWNPMVARFGGLSWIIFPILSLGAVLGLLIVIFGALILILLAHIWRQRFEKPALALARKCARDEGTVVRSDPLTIWWSGTVEPVPMLTEQLQIVRRHFEQLIEEPLDTPLVRVLVFEERRAYAAYHRNTVSDKGIYDCIYLPQPIRTITLSTEIPHFRLSDPARSARFGFALYLLENFKGYHPTLWLQSGISSALSADSGGHAREQLQRRMKVAIAYGSTLKATEFAARLTPRQARERMGPLVEHSSFARLMQHIGQCWSVIEFLAGTDAPAERLGRFRAFLKDLKKTVPEEEVFTRHFGHGFDGLLQDWQAWLKHQTLGADSVPPPEIRAAIIEKLVPAIRDRSKKAQDRVRAMRSLGATGYVLGANTLIDMLREGDERFTETATWSLEAISGLALGNDAARWSRWWAEHDPATVSALEFAEQD
jgi:hypothetical protein